MTIKGSLRIRYNMVYSVLYECNEYNPL